MLCNNCGSDQFEEENGLFYCCLCQTQSQGFTQESGQDFMDRTKIMGQELKTKKRSKRVVEQKTGVLWTTTEAFNLILFKQMNAIFEINREITNLEEIHDLTRIVWFTYLSKSGLAFTDTENCEAEVTRRLHPASRFRDIQILTNKVNNCLPPYRNGSTDIGFTNLFSLGSDGVIRTFEESKLVKEFECKPNKEEKDIKLFDIFNDRYKDPRTYAKTRSHRMKISNKSRKQLLDIMSKTTTPQDLEEFDNSEDEYQTFEDILFKKEEPIGEDIEDSPKSKASITSFDSLITNGFEDAFDVKLLKNLTKTTEQFSKFIPLKYLKKSSNINTNYFLDLMSLPKTLSILNVVFRLLCYDIYCFDLIRWVNEGHIPYSNCVLCFPEDWLLISNDFHTFTSYCVPSLKTISTLSAKIANYIEIDSFPRPNLQRLLYRFAKDLNLPKDIVLIIDDNYNLFEYFDKQLDRMSTKCRTSQKMPFYEIWTLMAILLVLKRIFILNDKSEKNLSHSAKDNNNLFNWEEWESYTRMRIEMIRSYFVPSYSGNLEEIREPNLITDHFNRETETLPPFGANKSAPFRSSEFRADVQQEFKGLAFEKRDDFSDPELVPKPSLYPLTNATNFVIKKINCSAVKEKLYLDFENKSIIGWTCVHGKAFHRGYEFLDSDPQKWSKSFKLLLYLSCFVLNCRSETLTPILKIMEKKYFGKRFP